MSGTGSSVQVPDGHAHENTPPSSEEVPSKQASMEHPALDGPMSMVMAAPPPRTRADELREQIHHHLHEFGQLQLRKSECRSSCQLLENSIRKARADFVEQSGVHRRFQGMVANLRATQDDVMTIKHRLAALEKAITGLAADLLAQVDEVHATKILTTLWTSRVSDAIRSLGDVLPRRRIQTLIEKFIMDVLVQLIDLYALPGLDKEITQAYRQLERFFHRNERVYEIRLRQEMANILLATMDDDSLAESTQFLSRKLGSICPRANTDQIRTRAGSLVREAAAIGVAIKGQEMDIVTVDTKELSDRLDPVLMYDEDGQTSGIITFCIFPAFVVYDVETVLHYPLLKGRVLCLPFVPPPPSS